MTMAGFVCGLVQCTQVASPLCLCDHGELVVSVGSVRTKGVLDGETGMVHNVKTTTTTTKLE